MIETIPWKIPTNLFHYRCNNGVCVNIKLFGLRNTTLDFTTTHSFTRAYSPGRTFGLPFRGFLITHILRHGRTPLDERSSRHRDLYLHRTTQHTDIHALSGIRSRNPSNQLCGHWDRLTLPLLLCQYSY
jgi:hypothetical protein